MTKQGSGKRVTYHNTGAPDIVTFANGVTTDYAIDDRKRARHRFADLVFSS